MVETSDQTLKRLNREIDEFRKTQLLMLADLHEERGEAAAAIGYRWLAERGRWPDTGWARPREGIRMRWVWSPTNYINTGWWCAVPNTLPGIDLISWKARLDYTKKYETQSAALLAAARKIGNYIKEYEACDFCPRP
jgi:hypothetical protein